MIIRRGKEEGWLHLDLEAAHSWLKLAGVDFTAAEPATLAGRGAVLVAKQDLGPANATAQELLTIPASLILSQTTIREHALYDRDFRELLDSLQDYGRTPRGAILSFLLFQASLSCPDLTVKIGVRSGFTEYVKTLPCELLPTFWTAEELSLLEGTTLSPAVSSKLNSLRREYDQLCALAANTRWYQVVQAHLEFDDWMQVDAFFRSRALDFHGSCMIPGLDLASHAPGDATNAFYDKGEESYKLWLLPGKTIQKNEEVTITYGDEKGACEMLFSYGFLDDSMETAETLFLSLFIPENDPYRAAKAQNAKCAPGFKLIDTSEDSAKEGKPASQDLSEETDHSEQQHESHLDESQRTEPLQGLSQEGAIDWSGDYVWLLCVNEDDGLSFELARTTDGCEEVHAQFQGQVLEEGAKTLRRILAASDLWDVYRLRATVILQQRVYDQLETLYTTQEKVELLAQDDAASVRSQPRALALKLRRLEFELLEEAYAEFERQKLELADSPVVKQYLADMNDSTVRASSDEAENIVGTQQA